MQGSKHYKLKHYNRKTCAWSQIKNNIPLKKHVGDMGYCPFTDRNLTGTMPPPSSPLPPPLHQPIEKI